MKRLLLLFALVIAALCAVSPTAGAITLTGSQRSSVDNGTVGIQSNTTSLGGTSYTVTNTDGKADFKISQANLPGGGIAGYPGLWVGCHFGISADRCTTNNPFPIQLSAMKAGDVPLTVQDTTPSSAFTGKWNSFFDIFYNRSWPPTQWGRSGGLEMGIRLDNSKYGTGGTQVGTIQTAGQTWNAYWNATDSILGYRAVNQAANAKFSGDLYPFVQFALQHGYLQPSWYLIDVEKGYEIQENSVTGLGDSGFCVAGRGDCAGTTNGDTTPPSTPTGLAVSNVTQTAATLSWTASDDNGGGDAVTGYHTFNGSASAGDVTATNKTFSGLACATTYTLGTQAFDAAGNVSGTATDTVTTAACPDTTPPSTPTGLSVSNQTQTGLTLSWTASTDNVGVTGYDVAHGSTSDGTTSGTSFNFTGLTCGTSYTLSVDAFDAAGNKSASATTSASTAACPTGPTTYYVDNVAGSDSSPGTQAAPFASLSKAQSAAHAGDSIALLRGDTWTGGLTITLDNVTIFGYGSATSRPKITGGVSGNCVTLKAINDVVDNIDAEACGYAGYDLTGSFDTVKNAKAGGNSVGVHADTGSQNASVLNDTISDNNILNQNTSSGSSGAFGVLLNGNGAVVEGNKISGSTAVSQAYGEDGSAVEIYAGSSNTVDHNTATNDDALVEVGGTGNSNAVFDNYDSYNVSGVSVVTGVVVQPGQTGATVEHNSIWLVGSQGQGIVCSSCTADTAIKDNVVHAELKDLYTDGTGPVTGNVFDPAAGTPSQPGSIAGNAYKAPALVGPPTDLHETASSPSVDFGSTAPSPTDLDGHAVPQGAAPDSGTYELTPAAADTTPPSTPTGLATSNVTQTGVTLSWTASTDNVGVTGYDVSHNSTSDGTTAATSFNFTGLTCGTTYTLAVDAFDAAGNKSSPATTSVTTSACTVQDTTPPSTPTGAAVSNPTQTSLTLTWNASTDNVGVTGYDTFKNNVDDGNVTTTSKTFTGLTCGTTYTLSVEAFDAAGNKSGPDTASGTTAACSTGGYQHIVWVVMENHSYSDIHGSSSAPYINSLMSTYGNATNMHAENHPSAPNYLAMTHGAVLQAGSDSYNTYNVPNIFGQLGANAKSLEQSMPSACKTSDSGNYAVRHNPEAFYIPNITSADCTATDLSLGATPDLSAKFTFITPDICHDMHSNSCSGSSDVIKQGDDFLKGFVPQLMATPQYQAGNTAIFVTWDEDHTSNLTPNQIPTVVIDPTATPSGACEATRYDHYSMLKYAEDTLGVPELGSAATATSMKGCFGL